MKTASLKNDSHIEKEPTEYRRRIEKKYDDYINKMTSSEGKFKSYKDQAAIELKPLRSTVIAFNKEKENKSILSRKSGSKSALNRDRGSK